MQLSLKVRCNSIHPAAILTPMWEPLLGQGPEREANMAAFVADTPLLGDLPELDSMAVIAVIQEIEARFGIEVPDDEVDGNSFATVGTVVDFVTRLSARQPG